jgi:hypothetical protein
MTQYFNEIPGDFAFAKYMNSMNVEDMQVFLESSVSGTFYFND